METAFALWPSPTLARGARGSGTTIGGPASCRMSSTTDQLILDQQPYLKALARNIAKTLPHHVDYDELVAFGQVGLAEAARGFEPSRGVSFTTFAHYRIRGAIFDGLRKMTWLPPAARRSVNEQAAIDELLAADQDSPKKPATPEDPNDPDVLARKFAQAVERLGAVFLISSVRDDEPGLDPQDRRAPAAANLETRELRARLKAALGQLSDEHGALIRMLYVENKSMAQVGELLKKNKSTVCRRHAEAIDALRVALDSKPKETPAAAPAGGRIRREAT